MRTLVASIQTPRQRTRPLEEHTKTDTRVKWNLSAVGFLSCRLCAPELVHVHDETSTSPSTLGARREPLLSAPTIQGAVPKASKHCPSFIFEQARRARARGARGINTAEIRHMYSQMRFISLIRINKYVITTTWLRANREGNLDAKQ